MTENAVKAPPAARLTIHVLVVLAGSAALSWEVIWQLKAALALGVSAYGTALTLATLMGGMSIGALAMGRFLRTWEVRRPVRMYGVLELIIGLSGLVLHPAFAIVERADAAIGATAVGPLFHVSGIALVMGPATIAMGATVPLFGLIARQYRTSISLLYGLNTAGASIGTLVIAFVLLPWLGVLNSCWLAAGLNLTVFALTWALPPGHTISGVGDVQAPPPDVPHVPPLTAAVVVFVTGFSTFALEVAWFRSLRSAFRSTTEAFAIMLAAVLIPLAIGAWVVRRLQSEKVPLSHVLVGAGALAIVATPLVERFDHLIPLGGSYQLVMLPSWFLLTLSTIGPSILLLGVALPWLLELQGNPRAWARLYAINTFAAIAGSLLAAWVLLPALGFARTAWLVGALVGATGVWMAAAGRTRVLAAAAVGFALLIGIVAESGVGRTRVSGRLRYDGYKILAFHEGPDATTSAVTFDNGLHALIIDGFETASEVKETFYMAWMGHLPMMLHPDPKRALVVCFGSGQTTNAVRNERPDFVHVVDINSKVFRMAEFFPTNEAVLDDPIVEAIVSDGRAWLRRTDQVYDVITTEPMPPFFAGINALYSLEYYKLAEARLADGGIIAQFLPFHLMSPYHAVSAAETFRSVFPDAALWVDPVANSGILVGRKGGGTPPIGSIFPGSERPIERNLSEREVKAAIRLQSEALARYGKQGRVITDDNQMLAYGRVLKLMQLYGDRLDAMQMELVGQAAAGEVTTVPAR